MILTPLYYDKITHAECLATTIRVRNYSLLAGIIICVIGFIIFLNFSADDFLSPGFIEKSRLLQGTQIGPQESSSVTLSIVDIKPVTLLVSSLDPTITFDIQVDGPNGMVFHKMSSSKSTFTFTPDSKGDYLLTIKNLSSKTTTVNVSDGSLKSYENREILLVVLSMSMIIGGNYLVVQNYFSSLRNYS